ncbi:MAG TPA: YoaK family protein [Stellaceae bacterium]|nr:YoaK family protein [Stellaceae bacterium]
MAGTLGRRLIARAAGMCLVAGFVDAIGYTELGAVFAANMTGNSVLMAIAMVRGQFAHAASYGVTLASFIAGAVIAAILRRLSGRAAVPLICATALLLAATMVRTTADIRLALLAMTMGFQGAAVSRFGSINLQTVVVTGTLVRLAENCVDRILPTKQAPEPGAVRLHLAAWIVYGAGAAVAIVLQHVMRRPLFIAVIVLLLVTIDVARDERRAR